MESLARKINMIDSSKSGLQRYLLVAYPEEAVSEKIIMEKEIFTGKYLQKRKENTKPHMTVASFVARENMEDTIIRYMQRICSQQSSFNVELNNYSGFPYGSIFIRIQNPQPFKVLAKELKVISNYVSSCSCPEVTFYEHPQLTIATRLPDALCFKAMLDYSQKTFHETFMVNELVLLRRSHEFDTCKTVHVLRLQPPEFKPYQNTTFH